MAMQIDRENPHSEVSDKRLGAARSLAVANDAANDNSPSEVSPEIFQTVTDGWNLAINLAILTIAIGVGLALFELLTR